jgi:hypothetical protein
MAYPSSTDMEAVTRRWLNGVQASQRRKHFGYGLAPWDEYRYFESPKTTVITTGVGLATGQIVGGEVRRIGLIIAATNAAGSLWISPKPETAQNNGIPFLQQTPYFSIYQNDWGNLVQVPWFFVSNSALTMYVIETILLPKWGEP